MRYDAYTLTKADGKGKWWEGLDPEDLYTGRNIVMPEGITTIGAADAWHLTHDRVWNEAAPPMNPVFAKNWFLRCQDLMDTYKPDLVYYDNTELPMGQYGLDVVAHYYNSCIQEKGKLDVVVTAKHVLPQHEGAFTLDMSAPGVTSSSTSALPRKEPIGT